MELFDRIRKEYASRFPAPPIYVRAPGRINLIGEHLDYNEGWVLPAAVDKYMIFAMSSDPSGRCNAYAVDPDEGVNFSALDLNPGESWLNYLMGVMDGFQRRGIQVGGIDVVFGGDIPEGAGLSSSAALCCGFALGLNELLHAGLDRLELARIAQYAEHEFAGVRCGLMDQYASLFSEEGHVLWLDCRTMTHQLIPFAPEGYELLLVNTHVKHSLSSTAYNDRRDSCERAVRLLQKADPAIRTLRDTNVPQLRGIESELGTDDFAKVLYVVQEIERVGLAVSALRERAFVEFGQLMYDTHWGLSQAYDVSCEELDWLVSWAAERQPHVAGARLMGGGFGGCTLNLVRSEFASEFRRQIADGYEQVFHRKPSIYSVKPGSGATLLNKSGLPV